MTTDLCPTCGTPRMGSFRFCRSCGFDYDAAVSAAPAPMPAAMAPPPVAGATALPSAMFGASTQPTAGSASVSTEAPAVRASAPPSAGSGAGAPAPAGDAAGATPPADGVVVIKVRDLKLAAGALVGGLIGAMITGAFIVPGLGTDRLVVAIVLGILTIVALAALGARAGLAIIGH